MKVTPLVLLAAGVLLTQTSAIAAEPVPAPQAKKAAVEQPKVICRKEVATGSIAKKRRVCRTERAWEQAAQQSRDTVTQGQMSGGSSGQ